MSLSATGARATHLASVRRRLTWPAILAALVLLADVAFLRWVGVPFWVQLCFAVFLAACTGTGALADRCSTQGIRLPQAPAA